MVYCQNCSETVRPVIALDIDGTIGDYHRSLFLFAEGWLGIKKAEEWIDTYDGKIRLAEHMKISDEVYRRMKLAYRQGGMKRTMPVLEGAGAILEAIRASGAELWITTTRPYDKFDSTDPDTREWLMRNGINFQGLIFDDDKYKILCDTIDRRRIVAVVDDLAKNCDRASQLGLSAILRRTQFNRGVSFGGRTGNGLQVASIISDLSEEWYEFEMGRKTAAKSGSELIVYIEELLVKFGIEPNEDMKEQFSVFLEAMAIYWQRSHSYSEIWRQYGAMSNLLSVARKTDRMMESWHSLSEGGDIHKDSMDDAIDLLNYCTFFIRNFRDGNLFGSAPERTIQGEQGSIDG